MRWFSTKSRSLLLLPGESYSETFSGQRCSKIYWKEGRSQKNIIISFLYKTFRLLLANASQYRRHEMFTLLGQGERLRWVYTEHISHTSFRHRKYSILLCFEVIQTRLLPQPQWFSSWWVYFNEILNVIHLVILHQVFFINTLVTKRTKIENYSFLFSIRS